MCSQYDLEKLFRSSEDKEADCIWWRPLLSLRRTITVLRHHSSRYATILKDHCRHYHTQVNQSGTTIHYSLEEAGLCLPDARRLHIHRERDTSVEIDLRKS
jgi:hypothetical protein